MSFVLTWLQAFALTQCVEMGVYVHAPDNRSRRERIALAFACSAITHPLVWFVIPPLAQELLGIAQWWTIVAIAEVFAVLAEAALLTAFSVRPAVALGWAIGANGSSFLIGLFCYTRLGWS